MPVADVGRARAVEVDRDRDVGFLGGALDLRLTHESLALASVRLRAL